VPAQASTAALALFEFGQAEAAKHGLILVDTKYEMGKAADGSIRLIDEVNLPGFAATSLIIASK
jgi:phosphoribosylaminoimidazole-succinocarboxamide synthase